jgi:hypothetical protein
MTEDEAKTKACCKGSQFQVSTSGACIASECMAWRWKFVQTNKAPQHMAQWPQPEPNYEQTDSGYCGLAGSYGA